MSGDWMFGGAHVSVRLPVSDTCPLQPVYAYPYRLTASTFNGMSVGSGNTRSTTYLTQQSDASRHSKSSPTSTSS